MQDAVASLIGTHLTNRANKKIANTQMQFQKEMSNTAYQRAMADMQKAGLNPILAGKMGGASTPAGAGIPAQDYGQAYTRGQQVTNAKVLQTAQADLAVNNNRLAKQNADYFDKKPYGSAVLNARPLNILLTEVLEKNPQLIDKLANSPKAVISLLSGDFSQIFNAFNSNTKDEQISNKIKLMPGYMPINKSPISKVKRKKDRFDIRLRQWGRKKFKGDFKK